MVNSILIVWIIAVVTAIASISHFMRKRQANLNQILMQHVKDRREWSRKQQMRQRLAEKTAALMRNPRSSENPATDGASQANAAPEQAAVHQGDENPSPARSEKTPAVP